MKNVVTATGVQQLNQIINQNPKLNVIDSDIYKQEILFEKFVNPDYNQADALVLMDDLNGPFSKYELVKSIKEKFSGEIFVILSEHDDGFINFLREEKITLFTVEDDPSELIDAILYDINDEFAVKTENQEVTEGTETVEKIYINKQVLAVVGTGGSGKTSVVMDLAKLLKKDKYDVCVLDANFEKSDIGRIAGVEEKGIQAILSEKEELSENIVLNAVSKNKGVHYFTGLQKMIEISEAYQNIKYVIKVLKKNYDVLIIDTGNIASFATHTAIMQSEQQLFLFNPGELSIRAVKQYLDLYKSLEKQLKASGLINQYVETMLDSKDIAEILGIRILGKIKLDKKTFLDLEKGKGFSSKDKKVLESVKDSIFFKKEEKFSFFGIFKKVVN